MPTLPRRPHKRPAETTISLINIVFLMLIFFLVAAQLSPPQDPEVTLAEEDTAAPLPPPDALYVRKDGSLVYHEEPVSPEGYVSRLPSSVDQEADGSPLVRLAADEGLPAKELLGHIGALYAAGAGKVVVVTRRER
jgi:biopolymer transport protein ExbD